MRQGWRIDPMLSYWPHYRGGRQLWRPKDAGGLAHLFWAGAGPMKTFSQIEAILRSHEKRFRKARLFVLGAAAIWLSVSIAALLLGSAGFFSRAGGLGTGLILVAFATAAAIRQTYQLDLLKALILVLRAEHIGTPPLSLPERDHHLELVERLIARSDRRSALVRAFDVGITLTATLQWAFGDLAANYLFFCGSDSC